MASPQAVPEAPTASQSRLDDAVRFFWRYLKQELKPYPDRGWMVVRMTLAAVFTMLWIMVFRIPNAALGAYYTLLISRESTDDTVESAIRFFFAIAAAVLIIISGGVLFAGSPLMRFLWTGATLLGTFFIVSCTTQYRIATGFGLLVCASIPLWDMPGHPITQVSYSLYGALSILVGAAITVVIEVIFAQFHRSTPLQDGIHDRIRDVAELLQTAEAPSEELSKRITQYADIGTGLLRRYLDRIDAGGEDYARQAVLVGLTGRLVDLSSTLMLSESLTSEQIERLHRAGERLDFLQKNNFHPPVKTPRPNIAEVESGEDFVSLIESTVGLLHQAVDQPDYAKEYLHTVHVEKASLIRRDWKTNPEHLFFALRGAGAAMICYTAYHLVAWKGIASAVATCMITALSTSGSSRQKQVLRITGAFTGGVIFGFLSQSVLLPHFNSITSFGLLYTAVMIFASWIGTSSPRISYFGLQVAFAFDIVQLRAFGPVTQLVPTRDNLVGVLFGLVTMWVIFDQTKNGNSSQLMDRAFVQGIRMMEDYIRIKPEGVRSDYLKQTRRQRDSINDTFAQVRAYADGVLFEFHAERERAMRRRAAIRDLQPQLRTFFLLQIALVHIRLRSQTGELSPQAQRLQEFNIAALERFAAYMEGTGPATHDMVWPHGIESGSADSDVAIALRCEAILRTLMQQAEGMPIH